MEYGPFPWEKAGKKLRRPHPWARKRGLKKDVQRNSIITRRWPWNNRTLRRRPGRCGIGRLDIENLGVHVPFEHVVDPHEPERHQGVFEGIEFWSKMGEEFSGQPWTGAVNSTPATKTARGM